MSQIRIAEQGALQMKTWFKEGHKEYGEPMPEALTTALEQKMRDMGEFAVQFEHGIRQALISNESFRSGEYLLSNRDHKDFIHRGIITLTVMGFLMHQSSTLETIVMAYPALVFLIARTREATDPTQFMETVFYGQVFGALVAWMAGNDISLYAKLGMWGGFLASSLFDWHKDYRKSVDRRTASEIKFLHEAKKLSFWLTFLPAVAKLVEDDEAKQELRTDPKKTAKQVEDIVLKRIRDLHGDAAINTLSPAFLLSSGEL